MTPCPRREVLAGLMTGGLAGPAADTVAEHLEVCAACRRTLDALSAEGVADRLRPPPPDDPPPPAAFLDRLKGLAGGASPPPPRRPSLPGYVLHEELGRGGAGVVYRATQLALDRTVAVKVLLSGAQAGEGEVARFRTEALAAARLDHPGVVRVFEVGEWRPAPDAPALPFVGLEYVGGGTLARAIGRTPQPPEAAAALLARLAAAVQAAHDAGVLHRDIKPSNVLLDAGGAPKLADFGLARRLDIGSAHTHTGMVLGTPSYMAPEQARGDGPACDARTDVYGLGAVLYELLTGRPPFQGPTPLDTVVQLATAEPIPPRRLQPTVPRDLETICLKCLEKSPAGRYPTAAALDDDLARYLAGRPTLARPLGPARRTLRLARRHPLPAALAVALAAVVAGSVAGLTGLYLRSEAARRSAEAARDDTRAMSDFLLKEILAAPRLDAAGRGRGVTVLQLLDAAAPKVDEAFAGRAEAAGVHQAFGETYLLLGEYNKAGRHLDAAVAGRTAALGPDHPDTLDAEYALGSLHRQAGRPAEAKAVFEPLLARTAAARGADHERTDRVRTALAGTYHYLRDFAAAGRLYAEVIDAARRRGAGGDSRLEDALVGSALVLSAQGKRAEAIVMLRESVALNEQARGPDAYETAIARGRLGEALLLAGDAAGAEPVLSATLAARLRLAPGHPSTYSVQGNLADAWLALGRPAAAEAAFRESLAGHRATMPAGDPLIPLGQTRLGAALAAQGRYAEAEPHLTEALAGFEAARVPRPDYRRRCVAALADLYDRWGKPAEAARWRAAGR